MNSIRLSTTFWTHPKTGKLIKRLGLDGVRSLQILWIWVAQNRPDGKLSGLDAEDIEFISSWNGEDGAFFKACLNIWIDETEEGYALHDWEDHQACASKAEERSGKARKAAQQRWRSKGSEHAQRMLNPCSAYARRCPWHIYLVPRDRDPEIRI